jgi:hypothetical protein
MKLENKKEVGRPFKMEAWLRALNEVLDEESTIFLSDKDLVLLVNRILPEENRITSKTFENWKAGKFAPNEDLGKEFIGCVEISLIKQKQLLGERLMNDTTGQWTRYAWILERKFSEWNLKHISENINKNEQSTVIQITAGSNEQKALIESIMNVDFEEIKPSQIQEKTEVKPTDNDEADELPF